MRVPAIACVVLALTALVSSCAPGQAGSADHGPPRPGGTLRLAIQKEPECLDPHQSPTEAAGTLARPIVDSLVSQDATGGIHPWLAIGWTISPDQLTYTFALRQGVRFSDGTPFDSAAVVANLEHVVAPATKSLLAANLIAAFSSAAAIDPLTVEVRLSRRASSLLGALATPYLGMESPRTLGGSASDLCTRIVGTGPFISDGGYAQQSGINYRRNPDYAWPPYGAGHDGPARLDGITVQVAPDNAARFGALSSGQVDAITAISPVNARVLKSTPGFVLYSKQMPGSNYSYWPNTERGPLSDPLVRKAFRSGVDWAQIVRNVYFGVYEPAHGVLSPTTPGYDASLEAGTAYDPAEAARLLDQAGWTGRDAEGYRTKNGQRLTLRHMWSDAGITDVAVQVQAAARQLGIQTVEENLDGGTYVDRILKGDYELTDTNFSAPGPEVLQVLYASANIPNPERGLNNNMARYDNPAVDADFDQAMQTTDQAARLAHYDDAQRQLTEDAAVFPLYTTVDTVAARDGVQDVEFDAGALPGFYDTWLAS
ncbi:ABC transporter substrate-binding protein [Amycolatopsis sp. GM8]|uniref:ABC transporter substrate-binding protein n=1 Tax=Amycolatopsis sp. GM8 TaxID=2896530 RepID=UPI001F2422D8|nr:ABC transporter substrate-binding protein [Amycolatopsis sp. GM8]